ncbi:MAG: hypothetical protein PHH84_02660 [Oscillospiraceae bacterium]|nr:hypothetical protein [Oscillospiraceae bacterium]MDD4414769.1 hypothetical protein [Oscillospiraceae bacterium]
MIQNYADFCRELLAAGFSIAGGGNDEGVFGLLKYGWNNEPPEAQVRWHTGDPEHDPWEWRMRVLDERNDIAYGKVFFRKAGYITREWYPYFLAARRNGLTFNETYSDGVISYEAKRIYEVLQEGVPIPLHALKQLAGFGKEERSKFERGLVELQMRLFITMCGRQQKVSQRGEEYGWSSTVFCTTEQFWDNEVFEMAAKISADEAIEAITLQVYRLNPAADAKKIKKFIYGGAL